VEGTGEAYTVVNTAEDTTGAAGRYTLKDAPYFSLDQDRARAIIGNVSSLTASRLVTDAAEAEQLESYGLARPKARVIAAYRDGTKTVWLVGDQAPTSTASYFMEEGESSVWLISASVAASLSSERNALHTLELPFLPDAGLIRSLLIESDGQDPVEIGYSVEGEADKEYSISALRLRQPFHHTANAERANEMFSGVAALSLSAYAGEVDELKDTGLEDGGCSTRLTVSQAKSKENLNDQETAVYRIGRRTEDGQYVYLMVDDTEAVYLTPASSVAFLENATPSYLVDQFANLIYIQAVNGIELTAGEERWELQIEHAESEKENDVYRFNGEVVTDAKAFRKLYQQIVGMTSSKISQDYQMEGPVLLSVRYQLGVDPGELLVEYIDDDENYCGVRREGLTLFLVKRDQVESLIQALREFSV